MAAINGPPIAITSPGDGHAQLVNETYKEDSKEMEEMMKDMVETEEAGDLFGV